MSDYWFCPKCTSQNPPWRRDCAWCHHHYGDGLSEADVRALLRPIGEVMAIWPKIPQGYLNKALEPVSRDWFRTKGLQDPAGWPKIEGWKELAR